MPKGKITELQLHLNFLMYIVKDIYRRKTKKKHEIKNEMSLKWSESLQIFM